MVATRSSTRGTSVEADAGPVPAATPATTRRSTRKSNPLSRHWAHTPSHLILVWLTVSLPLVAWDIGYMLGRPYTMPGGKWHSPIWSPYSIYCDVDWIYGWKAFNEKNGFSESQTLMNIVESAIYLAYLYMVAVYGQDSEKKGRGAPSGNFWTNSWWGRARKLYGREAALAVLLGFSASLMTFAKTMLYALHEHCSGYQWAGHNDFQTALLYYILPNGAWLFFSAFMTYVFGVEMVEGLSIAAGDDVRDSKILTIKDE